jgi:hypothetical protein
MDMKAWNAYIPVGKEHATVKAVEVFYLYVTSVTVKIRYIGFVTLICQCLSNPHIKFSVIINFADYHAINCIHIAHKQTS